MFTKADKGPSRLRFQDRDPSPNAAGAGKKLKLKADWFSIPARYPDLNAIENLFRLVRKEPNKQALSRNITTESFQEFLIRVIDTFFKFPSKKTQWMAMDSKVKKQR